MTDPIPADSSQQNQLTNDDPSVAESPRSPDILDSEPPRINPLRQDELNTNSPEISNELWREEGNGESNDLSTTVTYDGENSNSTFNGPIAPSELGEQSNSLQYFNVELVTDEDSRSLISLPETQMRKSENHIEEPPAKVRKIESPKSPTGDTDGETCPICLDSWGNSGDHKLVALKCGHLFGSKCVERWLHSKAGKDRSCPTCKRKAAIRDIRFIYARKLVAADTSELTALQKQIQDIQAEKNKVEIELQKSRVAHRACLQQLESLKNTLMKSQTSEKPIRKSWRFALEKNLEISREGGCRVMTYNCRTYELYVSQKSNNYLFPGYGIRKVSCVDYKLGQFVHLHTKPIRDITYSQPRDLLLSVGLDNRARIVERGIANLTFNSLTPLWSCSWDYLRSNEFYAGGVGGIIYQYDIRNPNTYVQRITAPGDLSPVASLCSMEYGLLSCQLNSCWLWVMNTDRQWEPRELPVEGPFMSLCYDNMSHRALISCRPGANGSERSRLSMCKFKQTVPGGEVRCEIEQTFSGSVRSSLMSRSTWVRAPGTSWIASHSESESALFLYGLDGARTMSLPASEPALDVCSVQLNGDTVLSALSETRLRLYKAVPSNS